MKYNFHKYNTGYELDKLDVWLHKTLVANKTKRIMNWP